jgi:hypothetical protein
LHKNQWQFPVDRNEGEGLHMKDIYASRTAWLRPLAIVAFFLGIDLGYEVHAACRQVCTPQTSCDHLSGEERWRCVAGRAGETSSCRTVCSESHGAIAYSGQTGSSGYAYDHDSQARANRMALGYCRRYASDCRIALNFVNQCGAIAETKQYEVGSGLGATKKEAESRSLAACRSAASKPCTVAVSVCSVK